jgi:hypothetical protein
VKGIGKFAGEAMFLFACLYSDLFFSVGLSALSIIGSFLSVLFKYYFIYRAGDDRRECVHRIKGKVKKGSSYSLF